MALNERWYIKYTIILAGIVLTIFAMMQAASILKLLLFSLFFSILVLPFCDWMERHYVSRIFSAIIAIICLVLFFVLVSGFFYIQIENLTEDMGSLQEPFEEILANLQQFLSSNIGFEGYVDLETIKETVYGYLSENTQAVTGWFTEFFSVLTSIVLVPVFMFLILVFRDFLQESAIKIFERKGEEQKDIFESIMINVKVVVQDYISGLLIVIAILAVIYSIMLTIIGVDYAIFFGVFAASLSVVPILGPIVGSIVPAIYALLTMDSLFYPIAVVAGSYLVEMLEGNFITPVILGSQVSLNALAALMLLYLGAEIWGLAGMVLFIPIGAILKVTFDEIESLQPFGYLLGRVPDEKFQKSNLAKKVTNLFRNND